jgi:hypothetical protein
LGPEREIDDPALQRMKLGPNVEPPENELLKAPPDADDVAATGGPAGPGDGRWRRPADGRQGLPADLGPGLITGTSDDDPSGIGTYSASPTLNMISDDVVRARKSPCMTNGYKMVTKWLQSPTARKDVATTSNSKLAPGQGFEP